MTWASAALVAVAIACFFATGRLLLATILQRTPLFWFERWAAAYMLGMAALSALWFGLAPFYRYVDPLWVLTLCSAGALLLCVFAKSKTGWGVVSAASWRNPFPADMALAALIAVECAALFVAALRTPLGFDGVFNFEMKASLMFLNPSHTLPVEYIGDSSRNWSHPLYPLLVPFG